MRVSEEYLIIAVYCEVEDIIKEKQSLKKIAKKFGRSVSTISREIERIFKASRQKKSEKVWNK